MPDAVDILRILERGARYAQRRAGKKGVTTIVWNPGQVQTRSVNSRVQRANARRGLKIKSDVLVIDLGESWSEPIVNEMVRLVKDGFERPRGKPSEETMKRQKRGKFWKRTGALIDGIGKERVGDGWVVTFTADRLQLGYLLNQAKRANRFMDARNLWKKLSPTVKRKAQRRAKVKKRPLKIANFERFPGD